jgi:hypothetical protein
MTQARQNKYLKDLACRRADESLRANVIFGQTLGWVLSLTGGFNYFILLDKNSFYVLMIGHALLFLGLAAPQSLNGLQKLLRDCGEFVSGLIFKLLLLIVYLILVCPLGILIQKLKGRAPFYYWRSNADFSFEGWIPKHSSDEGQLITGTSRIKSQAGVQLLKHFGQSSNLLIMPSLLVILILGLVSIFLQSTVVAPMIYTLF